MKTVSVTVPRAAQTIGVHAETVRRHIRAGRLRATRDLGGWYRIPLSELARLKTLYGVEEPNA